MLKEKSRIRGRGAKRKSAKLKAKTKPQMKARVKREPRTEIISFRLRSTESELLGKDLTEHPVAGIKSLKQFARKLTIDYARKRMVYVEHIDRQIDPDARERLQIEPPNCEMSDVKFLRAFHDFLSVPEHWRKLRLFVLRAGWPEKLEAEYAAAETAQDKLVIAQRALRGMIEKAGQG